MHIFKKKPIDSMLWLGIMQSQYSIIDGFMGTFLLAYLFNVSKGNVVAVGLYYLSYWLTIMILAYFTGFFLKTMKKIVIDRIGVIFNLLFFLSIYVLKEKSAEYMVQLGIIFGFMTSFKAFPRNLLVSQCVNEALMIKYHGYVNAAKFVLRITVPFLFGLVLSFESMDNVVLVLCGLLIIDFLLSLKFKEKEADCRKKFDLSGYFKRTLRNKKVMYIYLMEMFRGVALEGILGVVVVLYVVHLFKTSFNLGSLTSFFALCTCLMNYLFGRYCEYKYFVRLLKICSLAAVGTSFLFVLMPMQITFIFYNLSFATAARLLLMITTVNMFNISNLSLIKNKYQEEYFAAREIFLNAGRIIGALLLIVIGLEQNFELLRYFLLFLTIAMGIMGYYSILLNKSLHKNRH